MSLSALIVPLRDFGTAKTRLSEILSESQRSTLARLCAEGVLDRSVECHRIVVCDSDAVEAWAKSRAVETVRVTGYGLNAALAEALPVICARHPDADLVIAHGDIVEPAGLDLLVSARMATSNSEKGVSSDVVIVPDRCDDGTNVLRLGPAARSRWTFEYGPNSFPKHLQRARSLGLQTLIHRDVGLATDLDTPEDLAQPLARSFMARHFPDWTFPDGLMSDPPRAEDTNRVEEWKP